MEADGFDTIINHLTTISLFIQWLFYGFCFVCLIYFGYWFFRRFF